MVGWCDAAALQPATPPLALHLLEGHCNHHVVDGLLEHLEYIRERGVLQDEPDSLPAVERNHGAHLG